MRQRFGMLASWVFISVIFICLHSFGQGVPGTLAVTFQPTMDEKALYDLGSSEAWKRLLHYKTTLWGSEKSEIDAGDFFLSADGARDPSSELKATIKEFLKPSRIIGPLKQSPRCAFRARWRFVKTNEQTLGLSLPRDLDEPNCEKWDDFFKRFHSPKSATAVFSTAFPNNPASAFGHLFLRIGSSRSSDLLDSGINFAAQVPPDENSFAFITFGIFGGYYGSWSLQPYYEKINEYNKAENRDLWEYQLNLSESDTLFLIEHIWEFETSGLMRYYFFDENCAYSVLKTIEAVKPTWNLTNHTIYAIPGELTKNLMQNPEIVTAVKLRPSVRRRLRNRFDHLTNDESRQYFEGFEDKKLPQLPSPMLLETLNLRYEYERVLTKNKLSDLEKEKWAEVRSARAKLGQSVEFPTEIVASNRPDLGHDAYNLSVGMVSKTIHPRQLNPSSTSFSDPSGQGQTNLKLRLESAYHDLYNSDLGYKPYSEIQFPWIEYQWDGRSKNSPILSQVGLLNIYSLEPTTAFESKMSWKIQLGLQPAIATTCTECLVISATPGMGLSAAFDGENGILFGLLGLQTEAGDRLSRGLRVMPQVDLGVIEGFSRSLKVGGGSVIRVDTVADSDFNSAYEHYVRGSYSPTRNIDFRLDGRVLHFGGSTSFFEERLMFELNFYFR